MGKFPLNEDQVYNRKILYIIILFLLVISGAGLKFYFTQRSENNALRIKILSLNKIKRAPLPWSRLTQETLETTKKVIATTPSLASPVQKATNGIPIKEESTQGLAKELEKTMLNVKNLDLSNIDKNIEIADEIINREPDSYSAYKAKLILMIVKEGKFNQTIDDYELNKVLDSMAGFEIGSDTIARREAALIAIFNNEQFALENKLNDIFLLRDEISTQSAALDKMSPEYQELQIQDEQLATKEQLYSENLDNILSKRNDETSSSVYLNEDIVEIPFLRLMAKADHDTVIENAQSFIEQFPDSPTGYYYLVKALEAEGRTDEAIRAIEESKLPPLAQDALQDRLDATNGEDPKKYWEKLIF